MIKKIFLFFLVFSVTCVQAFCTKAVYKGCVNGVGKYHMYNDNGDFLGPASGPCCNVRSFSRDDRTEKIEVSPQSDLGIKLKVLDPKINLQQVTIIHGFRSPTAQERLRANRDLQLLIIRRKQSLINKKEN